MLRIFLLILAGFGLLALARWLGQQARRLPPKETQDTLQACTHCGVHVPQQEAIELNKQYFCCPEHRDAWLAEHE